MNVMWFEFAEDCNRDSLCEFVDFSWFRARAERESEGRYSQDHVEHYVAEESVEYGHIGRRGC